MSWLEWTIEKQTTPPSPLLKWKEPEKWDSLGQDQAVVYYSILMTLMELLKHY